MDIQYLDTFNGVFLSDPSKLHALLLAECQAHAATKEDLGSQLRTALLASGGVIIAKNGRFENHRTIS